MTYLLQQIHLHPVLALMYLGLAVPLWGIFFRGHPRQFIPAQRVPERKDHPEHDAPGPGPGGVEDEEEYQWELGDLE